MTAIFMLHAVINENVSVGILGLEIDAKTDPKGIDPPASQLLFIPR